MAGKGRPGPECRIQRAADALDDDGREVLGMVLDDRDTPHNVVSDALNEMLARLGADIGVIRYQQVGHHRSGNCRCEQE